MLKTLRSCLVYCCMAVLALSTAGCITTGGSLLDSQGFPGRYVAAMDGLTQARQAAALAVVAGALKPDDAIRKVGELDEAANKLALDRLVRGIATPEMDAALERHKAAKLAFDQAMSILRPSP